MIIPARVSFVTLAVRDMPTMARFYRQLGWPESVHNDEHHVAFQCGGAVLGLFGAEHHEREYGPAPPPGAFKAVTLAINVEGAAEVDAAYAALATFDGIRLLGPPEDLPFGGRGFVFRDPEDNVWDVIWAEGTSFDERGGLIFP